MSSADFDVTQRNNFQSWLADKYSAIFYETQNALLADKNYNLTKTLKTSREREREREGECSLVFLFLLPTMFIERLAV